MTGGFRSSLSTPRKLNTSRRPNVGQRSSHRGLMRDVSAVAPPVGRRRAVPLNAIIVPSARRADHLEQALHLSARAGTLLVVLASRESRAADVAALMASTPGCRGLVVEVPTGYEHPYFAHETSNEPTFRDANAERESDLSLKRNIGLMLARLLGWTKIMYLDDDIFDIRLDQVAKVSAQLDNHQVTGLVTRRFPDNSVVCHANRLSGANQDNFITGAAMGVNCADQPLPFFPNVYNEDWFFFMGHAARGDLPCVGRARQLEYKPFQDPSRAAREEFGDLLAEGLYALIGSGDRPAAANKNYWEMFADARLTLLDEISARLERVGTNEAFMAMSSVQAAREAGGKNYLGTMLTLPRGMGAGPSSVPGDRHQNVQRGQLRRGIRPSSAEELALRRVRQPGSGPAAIAGRNQLARCPSSILSSRRSSSRPSPGRGWRSPVGLKPNRSYARRARSLPSITQITSSRTPASPSPSIRPSISRRVIPRRRKNGSTQTDSTCRCHGWATSLDDLARPTIRPSLRATTHNADSNIASHSRSDQRDSRSYSEMKASGDSSKARSLASLSCGHSLALSGCTSMLPSFQSPMITVAAQACPHRTPPAGMTKPDGRAEMVSPFSVNRQVGQVQSKALPNSLVGDGEYAFGGD